MGVKFVAIRQYLEATQNSPYAGMTENVNTTYRATIGRTWIVSSR